MAIVLVAIYGHTYLQGGSPGQVTTGISLEPPSAATTQF
jgi:hypothetical protein